MSFSLSLFLHCTDVGRFLTDEINTVFASLDRQADVIASGVAKPPPRNSLLGMYIGLSEHADVVSHDGEDSPFSREAVNAHKHFCSMEMLVIARILNVAFRNCMKNIATNGAVI